MRRVQCLLATAALLVACGGVAISGEQPDQTMTGEPAWSSVVVDATGVTGQMPSVVVGADGRVGVAYVRELGDGDQEVAWSACTDRDCTSMTHASLARGRVFITPGAAPSGSGVVIGGGPIDDEGHSSGTVWACDDWECSSPAETSIGDMTGLAVVAAAGGRFPVVGYSRWVERSTTSEVCSYEMVIGLCDDLQCATHRPVSVFEVDIGYGNLTLDLLPDGSPVIVFAVEGEPDWPGRWIAVVCSDPQCTNVSVHQPDPIGLAEESPYIGTFSGAIAGSDIPGVVYAAGNDLRRLECTDPHCTTIGDRSIYTVAGVTGAVAAVDTGDSTLVLVQYAADWPDEDGPGFFDWKLATLACDADGCAPLDDVPFTQGNHVSIGSGTDGTTALAVQTGRYLLCGNDGCADPASDLSVLTLYISH